MIYIEMPCNLVSQSGIGNTIEVGLRSMKDQDKLRLLLAHWVEHNREHAEQFRQWAGLAGKLESLGSGEAASKLEAAVQEMKVVNDCLLSALDIIGGPLERHH